MMATLPSRSFDLGRVLSTGFNTLFKNAVPFLTVSLVLAGLPGFALEYWMRGVSPEDPDLDFVLSWQFWGPIVGGILVMFIASAVLQGTLIGATIRHLSGRPVDIGQSVSGALARIVPIILLSILVGLAITLGFLALIVPGVIVYLMFIVSVPAMMAEGRGVTDSMSRSVDLTKGFKGMIFLLAIILLMVGGGVSGVFSALFDRIAMGSAGTGADRIIYSLGTMFGQTVISAISAVVVGALYVELRTVKEGASTEAMAEVFA
jgi:hypothetical protein